MRRIPRILTTLFCLLQAFQVEASEDTGFALRGWSEAVVSVSDLERQRDFFTEVGGWKVLAEGPVDSGALAAWGLPPEVTGHQVLVGNPGTDSGYVRLVRFEGAQQRQIRSNARSWETGGILDINVRVRDMNLKQHQLRARGWQAHTDPVQFTFGPFTVREWITLGPDSLSIALIQRIAPELEGWPHLREFSRAFNSTQVVRDLDLALEFYGDVLGFEQYLYHEGASPPPGENVLGLPWEAATRVVRKVWIGSPDGSNEGSVELIEFVGASGRDFSAVAVPPNLGLLMLRFPVQGLDLFLRHLEEHSVPSPGGINELSLPPYGPARQVSVRAPDGAWLDFYELDDPGLQ